MLYAFTDKFLDGKDLEKVNGYQFLIKKRISLATDTEKRIISNDIYTK